MASDRRGPLDHDLLRRVPALRRHLVVSSAAAAAGALLIVAQAEIVARTLVSIIDGRVGSLTGPVAWLVGVGLARALVTAVVERSGATAMRSARVELRRTVLDHAAVDARRDQPGVAAREATVATSGLDHLDPYVRDYLPALAFAVAVPLAAGARILSVDWVSAAIVTVTVPLIPIFMVLIGQLTERRSRRQWAVLQRLAGHFLDVLEGLPTLRLFGRARAQAGSVRRASDEYRSATVATLRVAFLSALALELLATLSVAVVAVAIGLRLAAGGMELEPALVVLLLAPECYLPLRRVGAAFHAAEAGNDAADDLRSVLDRPTFPSGTREPPTDGRVRVRELRVDGRTALAQAVDIELRPGSITVVTGPSGVGKSTVLDAIRGRVAGRSGSVTVGGVDLADLDAAAWASRLAVVPQRPEPLAGTIADEVRGGTGAGDAAVLGAVRTVGLTELSSSHDPAELSGGQLRRVQVARALLAVQEGPADLVLADEPTAQLDPSSAELVRDALVGLARSERAAVAVATHDEGWLAVADRVVDLGAPSPTTTAPSSSPTAVAGDDALGSGDGRNGSPSSAAAEPAGPAPVVSLADAACADPAIGAGDATGRWRHVAAVVRPLRVRLAIAAALGVLAEVCTLGLAGTAAWLVVRAGEQPDLADLAIAVTCIRAFGIGKGVLRYSERLASHDVGFRMLGAVRAQLVDRLADVAPIPGWRRGDLLRRAVDDVDRLLDLVVRIVVPWTAIGVTTFGAVVIVAVLDPGAGIAVAATVALIGVVLPWRVARHERRLGAEIAPARAVLADRVLGVTERVDLLVGAGLLAHARGRVESATERVESLEWSRAVERMVSRALLAAAPSVAVAAVLSAVGPEPSVSAPVLGVLVLWPLAVVELLSGVADGARTLPELAASADRVDQLLALRRDPSDERLRAGDRPEVLLDAVTARWPTGHADLGPYDLVLPPGGRATVTGPSGSGKSTLAAAMVRYCPIVGGHYAIDGDDAGSADPDDVREVVLWIDQHPWIGDSSLRENLKIGKSDASDEELVDVLRIVELDGWLAGLPNGLDTRVGRRGHAMSGGEAHRVGLARAVLAGHPVVVLDEPVSHLDHDMGSRVLGALDVALGGRSLLTLGHDAVQLPDRTADGPLDGACTAEGDDDGGMMVRR